MIYCTFCRGRIDQGKQPLKNCGNCAIDRRDAKDPRPQAERWLDALSEVMSGRRATTARKGTRQP